MSLLRLAGSKLTKNVLAARIARPVSMPVPKAQSLRAFSTAVVGSAASPSKLRPIPVPTNPLELAAQQQLLAGNPAEAYGIHPDAGLVGKSGLVEKYGLIPTVGLFLAAAVSKEWIILDEEILLLGTFSLALFTGYISLRESVKAGLDEDFKANMNALSEGFNAQLDEFDALNENLRSFLTVPQDLQTFVDEQGQLKKDVIEAAHKYYQYKLATSTEKVLTDFENLERKTFSDYRQQMVDGAVKHATDAFTTGPNANQLRKDSVEAAVRALSTGETAGDPVGLLFAEYTKQFESRIRGEVNKSQKAYFEQVFAKAVAKRNELVQAQQAEFAVKPERPAEFVKLLEDLKALDSKLKQKQ